MTWLHSVRPVVDWASGEIYIPHVVSTSFIRGEWLQAAIMAGILTLLSSHGDSKELQYGRVREGFSIIKTPQFWQIRKGDSQRLWTTSPSRWIKCCDILKDVKNNGFGKINDQNYEKLFPKRLCNYVELPRRSTIGSSRYDLSATHEYITPAKSQSIVNTGLSISFLAEL